MRHDLKLRDLGLQEREGRGGEGDVIYGGGNVGHVIKLLINI